MGGDSHKIVFTEIVRNVGVTELSFLTDPLGPSINVLLIESHPFARIPY